MSFISSHRSLRDITMRVLILTAIFACAVAAPSNLLVQPQLTPIGIPIAYSAVPTISSGDIQAAAIDAQVKAGDLAQEAIDKARAYSEQASLNLNEKVISASDLVKEKSAEAIWSIQEKQWQALDALKTAEAQIDGSIASQADVIAKSVVSGVSPYVAVAPVAPLSPLIYTPGLIAPGVKSISTQSLVQSHPATVNAESLVQNNLEAVKTEDSAKSESLVKSAEKTEAKPEGEAAEGASADAVTIETKKVAESADGSKAFVTLAQGQLVAGTFGLADPLRYQGIALAPIGLTQPVLNYASIQPYGLAPTIVKTVW